jgi:hypothetical protein
MGLPVWTGCAQAGCLSWFRVPAGACLVGDVGHGAVHAQVEVLVADVMGRPHEVVEDPPSSRQNPLGPAFYRGAGEVHAAVAVDVSACLTGHRGSTRRRCPR